MQNLNLENLTNAGIDFIYLMRKKYPQKAVLQLIGSRYLLSGIERIILQRGVDIEQNNNIRIANKTDTINDNTIAVDFYNIVLTIANYLYGKVLFLSTDSFLRDTGGTFRSVKYDQTFDRALDMLFTYLKDNALTEVHFFLDAPISKSGDTAHSLNGMLKKFSIQGFAETVRSPDYVLIHTQKGIICTSDSVIIEKSKVQVFDLAYHIISSQFQPDFLDIRELLIQADNHDYIY